MTEEELFTSLQKNIEILSVHPRYIRFWAYTWGKHTELSDFYLKKTVVPVRVMGGSNYKYIGYIDRETLD
jgi:hypothetical protein